MRTVLLAVKNDPTALALYHRVKQHVQIEAVLLENKEPLSLFLKRRIKKLGVLNVTSQIFFKVLVIPFLQRKTAAHLQALKQKYNFDESEIPASLRRDVESINEESCIIAIRELRPELILVNGTRILSKKLLSEIKCPVLNVHAGITPLYRGVHGGYWARVQNDIQHCGVTVHLIDPGIDTGGILYQQNIKITMQDNFLSYPVHQLATGLDLLEKAIQDVKEGKLNTIPAPQGTSKLWYHPGFFEYLWNGIRKGIW